MDHCHESGRFRGWLCSACNSALGHAKDSPHHLQAAIAYLEKHRATLAGPETLDLAMHREPHNALESTAVQVESVAAVPCLSGALSQ